MGAEMYSGMSSLQPPSPAIERGVALHKMIRAVRSQVVSFTIMFLLGFNSNSLEALGPAIGDVIALHTMSRKARTPQAWAFVLIALLWMAESGPSLQACLGAQCHPVVVCAVPSLQV